MKCKQQQSMPAEILVKKTAMNVPFQLGKKSLYLIILSSLYFLLSQVSAYAHYEGKQFSKGSATTEPGLNYTLAKNKQVKHF